MSRRIVEIEAVGPDRRARRLLFDDGTSRTTSASVVKELRLDAGTIVDEHALHEAEQTHVKERALRLIGYRERAPVELARRLMSDGYPEPLVRGTVERYEELELVDEARFAQSWVRTRACAGRGRRAIERELRERGVSDEVIDGALEALSGTEIERAVAQVRSRRLTDRTARQKEIRRLVSRGFDLGVAVEAVSRATGPDAFEEDEIPFISE